MRVRVDLSDHWEHTFTVSVAIGNLGDEDGDLRSICLEDRVEGIQRLKDERQEHEVRLHLHTRTSARRIRCAFHHIVIVSEQRTANQTPYNTWFADHVGGTANQIRFKAATQTRLFTETMCKKYVVITLQAQACNRKRPIIINLDLFT